MSNINKKIDVIVLSLVVDEKTRQTTQQCVNSYLETADKLINKIFVVETNINDNTDYKDSRVTVIKPNKQFNYNEFFNIALAKCEAGYIAGPNNDLIIQENCLQCIVKEFETNPNIDSISPIDRQWHRHSKMYLPTENKLYYGSEVSLHMFGCMFVCKRSVFKKIGFLDERFYFFYQDNDYVMSVTRCGLQHGVHTGAKVSHQSGHSNNYAEERLKYTPKNMDEQGRIFINKWFHTEPFKSGNYQQFRVYA